MTSNKKITMRQLQILIILSAMGTGVIVLPRRAADFLPEGAQDGWVLAIGLTVIAMLTGVLVSAAARAAQKAAEFAINENAQSAAVSPPSFIHSASILLTKPVAYTLGFIMWLKLIIAAGLELRIFLEISNEIMLPNTPVPVVGGVMLAACAYAAAKGFETRARVAEVLFALMILPFLFLFTVAIMDADFSNLQPVFVNDARSMIYGSVRLGFILTGLECLLLVSPYVPREKSLVRAVAGALAVAGVIITGITVITIASFGRGVASEPWPVLNMMDVINLPGSFIERQEALMFGFWIITAFALGNALLFFGGILVTDVFRAKLRTGVILTALGVFGVSVIPLPREAIYAQMDYLYMTTGVFFLAVLPLALLIAAKITMWGKNKMLAKSAALMMFLAFAAFLLVGCWDKVEIENRAFVVAMGIDKDDENYIVTLSVPILGEKGNEGFPLYGGKGEEDDEKEQPDYIKKASGKTITEALKKLDSKNGKHLYYGQTKLVILGAELLEDSEMFQGALNTLEGKLVATRRIHVLSTKNPTDILSAKPPGEIMPGSYVSEIYRDKNKIGGRAFALDFERLSTITDKYVNPSGNAIIPKLKRDKDELELSGAAVLKNIRKTCTLSPKELQGLLWCFDGGNKGAVVTVDDISMKIESHKAKISFLDTSPLRAIVEITAKGTVDEIPKELQDNRQTQKALEELFAFEITKEAASTANLLQTQHALDAYNFLENLRKKNYPLYKKYADNWDKTFEKMDIVPQVTVIMKV